MDQYVGEIRYFTYFRGAPSGWLICDGSTPAISQYQALGTLLGNTYGGDGSTTFGLPDLRGRVAIGGGPNNSVGQVSGAETVTLNTVQMPSHQHAIVASLGPTQSPGMSPSGQVFANNAPVYYAGTATTSMSSTMIGVAGQGLPHENCAPTLPLVACICFEGVWPQQNN